MRRIGEELGEGQSMIKIYCMKTNIFSHHIVVARMNEICNNNILGHSGTSHVSKTLQNKSIRLSKWSRD